MFIFLLLGPIDDSNFHLSYFSNFTAPYELGFYLCPLGVLVRRCGLGVVMAKNKGFRVFLLLS